MTGNGTIRASVLAGGVTDAAGNGNTASTSSDNTVTFVLNSIVNQAPVADAKTAFSDNGDSTNITLSAGDADGDSLSFTIVDSPDNGTLNTNTPAASCNGNTPSTCTATVTYTHNGSATTADTFTYKVNDGRADSAVVTVTITIDPLLPTGEFQIVLPFVQREEANDDE
jgi:hypothetical protein